MKPRWQQFLVLTVTISLSLAIAGAAYAAGPQRFPAAALGSPARQASSTCPNPNPPRGDVTISTLGSTDDLNPATAVGPTSENIIVLIFQALTGFRHKAPYAALAAAVPTEQNGGISKDGTTITYHLRSGLKWSDGQALTADDVVFDFNVDLSPQLGDPFGLSGISSVTAPDPSTVVERFKAPAPYFASIPLPDYFAAHVYGGLSACPSPQNCAGPAGQIAADTFTKPGEVVNGPYIVSDYMPGSDGHITFKPNPNYYGPGCSDPPLDSINFTPYNSTTDLLAATNAGQVNMAWGFPLADLSTVQGNHGSLHLNVAPGIEYTHVEINVTRPGLTDANLRLALALAIDKIGLVQRVLKVDQATATTLTTWTPYTNAPTFEMHGNTDGAWDPYVNHGKGGFAGPTGNQRDARKLVQASGYQGETLQLYIPGLGALWSDEAQVLQADWKQVGINVNVVTVPLVSSSDPGGSLFGNGSTPGVLANGTFDLALFALPTVSDPSFLAPQLLPGSIPSASNPYGLNFARVSDKVFNREFTILDGTFKAKKRAGAGSIVLQQVIKQGYWVPLFDGANITTDDGTIGNFMPSPAGNLWNVAYWTYTK